jgi:hypothetical protein
VGTTPAERDWLLLPDIGSHASAGKCLRQREGRARNARTKRPRIRHERNRRL